MDSKQEIGLLKDLLFNPKVSRNRQFAKFEESQAKRLHKIARILRNVRKELLEAEVEYWTEPTDDGRVCLHLYRPHVGSKRCIFLTKEQVELLTHQRWEECIL